MNSVPEDIEKMLEYFEILKELPPAKDGGEEGEENVLRKDEAVKYTGTSDILKAAPQTEQGMFTVPLTVD